MIGKAIPAQGIQLSPKEASRLKKLFLEPAGTDVEFSLRYTSAANLLYLTVRQDGELLTEWSPTIGKPDPQTSVRVGIGQNGSPDFWEAEGYTVNEVYQLSDPSIAQTQVIIVRNSDRSIEIHPASTEIPTILLDVELNPDPADAGIITVINRPSGTETVAPWQAEPGAVSTDEATREIDRLIQQLFGGRRQLTIPAPQQELGSPGDRTGAHHTVAITTVYEQSRQTFRVEVGVGLTETLDTLPRPIVEHLKQYQFRVVNETVDPSAPIQTTEWKNLVPGSFDAVRFAAFQFEDVPNLSAVPELRLEVRVNATGLEATSNPVTVERFSGLFEAGTAIMAPDNVIPNLNIGEGRGQTWVATPSDTTTVSISGIWVHPAVITPTPFAEFDATVLPVDLAQAESELTQQAGQITLALVDPTAIEGNYEGWNTLLKAHGVTAIPMTSQLAAGIEAMNRPEMATFIEMVTTQRGGIVPILGVAVERADLDSQLFVYL